MKRAPIVLAATVAGLAGTLGFKAQEPTTQATAAISSTDTGTSTAASGSTDTGSSSSSSSSTSSGSTSGTDSSTSSGTTEQASSQATTVTSSADTQYGAVQLKVTIQNGKVTAIENVALPSNDPHSSQISASVGSTLQQSALSHADGTVDAVSGATYTSAGYQQALQAAIDQAGNGSSTQSGATS